MITYFLWKRFPFRSERVQVSNNRQNSNLHVTRVSCLNAPFGTLSRIVLSSFSVISPPLDVKVWDLSYRSSEFISLFKQEAKKTMWKVWQVSVHRGIDLVLPRCGKFGQSSMISGRRFAAQITHEFIFDNINGATGGRRDSMRGVPRLALNKGTIKFQVVSHCFSRLMNYFRPPTV